MFETGARYEGLPLADLVSDFTQAFEKVQEKKREMGEQGYVWWSEYFFSTVFGAPSGALFFCFTNAEKYVILNTA